MKPYDQKTSPVTIIDFFLISPNVESLGIENINLKFEHSDHNPVKAKFRLKKVWNSTKIQVSRANWWPAWDGIADSDQINLTRTW